MSFSDNIAIISCDVYREELLALGCQLDRIHFLEMGLHDDPDNLRKQIQRLIIQVEENATIDTILLAYGLCGNGIVGLKASRCRLVVPRAHDCIAVLLGSQQRHQGIVKENPGTYFYSPGWVRGKRVPGPDRDRQLREFYAERYPDDPEMVDDLIDADQEAFAHHNCAAYIDFTKNEEAEDYCKDCAKSLGWKFRRLEGDSKMMENFLTGQWNEKQFLVLDPGQEVALAVDDRVIQSKPVTDSEAPV